jgi:cytochrome c553
MIKKTVILAIFVALAALTTEAADAKTNWEKHCTRCHGATGKGDTKMGKKMSVRDYTDPKVQAAMTDAEMTKIIKEGKKEGTKTLMKAYTELSDAEIKDLVAYIRTMKK